MEPIPAHGVAAFRPGLAGETRSVPTQLLAAQHDFNVDLPALMNSPTVAAADIPVTSVDGRGEASLP